MEVRDRVPFDFQVVIALALGATGLVVHSWLIFSAYTNSGVAFPKWVTQISYNSFGEGYIELVLIPMGALYTLYILVVFLWRGRG